MSLEAVQNLWFERQGLAAPRGSTKLTRRALTRHLESTGGLQLDSVNAVDRGVLEIKRLYLEREVRLGRTFHADLRDALLDLATFLGAADVALPRGWGKRLG